MSSLKSILSFQSPVSIIFNNQLLQQSLVLCACTDCISLHISGQSSFPESMGAAGPVPQTGFNEWQQSQQSPPTQQNYYPQEEYFHYSPPIPGTYPPMSSSYGPVQTPPELHHFVRRFNTYNGLLEINLFIDKQGMGESYLNKLNGILIHHY